MGLNQELRTGPYSKQAIILKKRGAQEEYYSQITKSDIYKCLDDIEVEEVVDEVIEIIKREKEWKKNH